LLSVIGPRDKLNILHVFATLPIGGAEEHLRTVLLNMDAEKFKPLICTIGEPGAIGDEIASLGFPVVSLGRMKKKSWDRLIVKDLRAIIRERKIDLVHAQLYHANMYGRVAALMERVPAIITEHNVYEKYKYKRRLVNRFLGKKTSRVIAVSKPVRDYIIKRDSLDPAKVEVIYNGIECERFSRPSPAERERARRGLGLGPDIVAVGMISRLARQKGHVFMLRALGEAKKQAPGIKLIVAGDGPLRDELAGEAKRLGLMGDVVFLGARRDVPAILKALDIYAMPSLWEGHPMALLEAMSTGLPVVASRVGGVPDVVEDGVNGILIVPEDAFALASRMVELAKNPELRERLGKEAGVLVGERFSAKAMVERMERLYVEVVKGARV
jgi:glycosyltransferase involved in cell wall biosynthesis